MPERLSVTNTLDAIRVYCYHWIQSDEEDLFDESFLFEHLNARVSKAMLRIAIQELRTSDHFVTQMRDGVAYYRATIRLLQAAEAFLTLKQLSHIEWLEQNVGNVSATTDNVNSDTWAPLKNEGNTSQKADAISAIEDVVRHVEADNGFAASQPDVRNSLLYSLKAGVGMLKEHTPSREQVSALLLKPLKYLGDLFAKHAISELTKKATDKLLAWLSGS